MSQLFGATTNLVPGGPGGQLTLMLPANAMFWAVNNQDVAPLMVLLYFVSGSTFGIPLNPFLVNGVPTVTGWSGDYVDSIGFPQISQAVLTSTLPTAQFGSGWSPFLPVNNYTYGRF